jgi:hypothetical protein
MACGYASHLVSRHKRDNGPFLPCESAQCLGVSIRDRATRRRGETTHKAGRAGLLWRHVSLLSPDCIASHRIPPTPVIIDGASEPQSRACACAVAARMLRSRPSFGRSGIHLYALVADVFADQGLADEFGRCACMRRAGAGAGARASALVEPRTTGRMQRRQTQASSSNHAHILYSLRIREQSHHGKLLIQSQITDIWNRVKRLSAPVLWENASAYMPMIHWSQCARLHSIQPIKQKNDLETKTKFRKVLFSHRHFTDQTPRRSAIVAEIPTISFRVFVCFY